MRSADSLRPTFPAQVVATYIESLKHAAVDSRPAKPKTGIRVDFGGEGPIVALASGSATSSIMSSTGSFMQSDLAGFSPGASVGGAPTGTAANAVSAYMAALKQRAHAAAAEGRSGGSSDGGGGGGTHAASEPNARLAVDAYLAGAHPTVVCMCVVCNKLLLVACRLLLLASPASVPGLSCDTVCAPALPGYPFQVVVCLKVSKVCCFTWQGSRAAARKRQCCGQ